MTPLPPAQVRIPDPQLLSHKCLLQLPVLSAHTAQQGYKPHLTLKEKNHQLREQDRHAASRGLMSWGISLSLRLGSGSKDPSLSWTASQGACSALSGHTLPSGSRRHSKPPRARGSPLLSPHVPDKQGPPPPAGGGWALPGLCPASLLSPGRLRAGTCLCQTEVQPSEAPAPTV